MIKTKVFRFSRTELARIASEEYIRSFWWLIAIVPLAGLVALFTMTGPLQVLGMLAVLWPFSIPARSVITTTKASRLFTGGCHVVADVNGINFLGEYHEGRRLRFTIDADQLKEAVNRRGVILLRMRRPGIAMIRADAFESEADLTTFLKLIEDSVSTRIDPPADDAQG